MRLCRYGQESERHRAELQHPGFPGQQQHLDEQPFDPVEKTPPERGDGIVGSSWLPEIGIGWRR